MSNKITLNTPICTKICRVNGNSQGWIDEIEEIYMCKNLKIKIKLKSCKLWKNASDYVIIDTGEKMEKVKLTKKEFIKRSMNGEIFACKKFKYFYDETKDSPFRITNLKSNSEQSLYSNWIAFDGENEFEVIPPQPKTKIVKEWKYRDKNGRIFIHSELLTEKEAKERFENDRIHIYQSTGREFEVPNE